MKFSRSVDYGPGTRPHSRGRGPLGMNPISPTGIQVLNMTETESPRSSTRQREIVETTHKGRGGFCESAVKEAGSRIQCLLRVFTHADTIQITTLQ